MRLVIKIPSDAICIINPNSSDAMRDQNPKWRDETMQIQTYNVVFDRLLSLFLQSCPYLRVVYSMAAYGELFNFM